MARARPSLVRFVLTVAGVVAGTAVLGHVARVPATSGQEAASTPSSSLSPSLSSTGNPLQAPSYRRDEGHEEDWGYEEDDEDEEEEYLEYLDEDVDGDHWHEAWGRGERAGGPERRPHAARFLSPGPEWQQGAFQPGAPPPIRTRRS